MRNMFINELVAHAKLNPSIALIVGDLGYSVIEPFADSFPDRFVNAGVAEQNMAGLAAGMASEGYHVFIYSIANFPTFRCAEQIRNDIDYQNLPVTVVAVGGGLAYGALGYSHHAIQDYAMLRTFPNMLIAAPGDPLEVKACMQYLIKYPQPSYLRLGKAGEEVFHAQIPNISPGSWVGVAKEEGHESPILLTTGAALGIGMERKRLYPTENYSVYSMPLWGMGSKSFQLNQVREHQKIITLEDHLIDGGFGSWMLESLCSNPSLRARIENIGLDSRVCGMVGSQSMLNEFGGLK